MDLDKIVVKIEKDKDCLDLPIPRLASKFASGIDLYSAEKETVVLNSGDIKLISTGIKISLPVGYEAQIRPRSGLAYHNGITVLNSPGTIDSDYRGEIKIILINHGKKDFFINRGDRIAQMVFQKVVYPVLKETNQLDQTKRGEGGFGHTGIKSLPEK